MSLLIGFEFEFGWLPEISGTPSIAKKTRKAQYFNQHVYHEVEKNLRTFLKKDFQYIYEIKEDSTLHFGKNYYSEHFGVEVVTQPIPEHQAIKIFQTILSWMKQNQKIITNSTCSLHVNISFKNSEITESIDYLKLLNNTPQDDILLSFKRHNNKYCTSSFNKKFSIEQNCRISKSRTYHYWINKINKKTKLSFLTTGISFGAFNYNSQKEKLKETIIFNSKKDGLQFIDKIFLEKLNSIGKNLAIVEKRNPAGKRYFEFRMIGNKNYHLKEKELFNTIQIYNNSIKKAVTISPHLEPTIQNY